MPNIINNNNNYFIQIKIPSARCLKVVPQSPSPQPLSKWFSLSSADCKLQATACKQFLNNFVSSGGNSGPINCKKYTSNENNDFIVYVFITKTNFAKI